MEEPAEQGEEEGSRLRRTLVLGGERTSYLRWTAGKMEIMQRLGASVKRDGNPTFFLRLHLPSRIDRTTTLISRPPPSLHHPFILLQRSPSTTPPSTHPPPHPVSSSSLSLRNPSLDKTLTPRKPQSQPQLLLRRQRRSQSHPPLPSRWQPRCRFL